MKLRVCIYFILLAGVAMLWGACRYTNLDQAKVLPTQQHTVLEEYRVLNVNAPMSITVPTLVLNAVESAQKALESQ